MKKTRAQKGITLIALIITIVVLLILAAVAINSIQDDGILGYAKNAASKYNQAQKDEADILSYYELVLAGKVSNQSGTTVTRNQVIQQADGTTKKETLTLQVGDYVNYTAGVSGYNDTNGWRVLGTENGQLLLMSTNSVGKLSAIGVDGYVNGIKKLNEACEPFLNADYATTARSIKLSDINRVTGYNPETAYNGKAFIDNTDPADDDNEPKQYISEYGINVTYSLDNGKIKWNATSSKGVTLTGTSSYTKFLRVGETANSSELNTGITEQSSYYLYYPNTLTTRISDTEKGLSTTSNAYKMLFKNADNSNKNYFVADTYIKTRQGGVMYGLMNVAADGLVGASQNPGNGDLGTPYINGTWMWASHQGGNAETKRDIYAVVAIKPDLQLKPGASANTWVFDV